MPVFLLSQAAGVVRLSDAQVSTPAGFKQVKADDRVGYRGRWHQVGDDTHAIILGKDYPVVSVGSDEIAQLWTGENLDVGELGFYYNNDPAIGTVYGSLVGADMATMLDYKLRGVEYNPSIDGRIDFNSFLPVFAAIGTGDFALEIEVDIKTFSAAAVLRADGDTATARFEIAAAADGGLTVTQLLTGTEAGTLAATGQAVGVHAIKISRTAGAVTLQIDGTSQSWTGDAIDLSAATMAAPYSNANCVLRSVKLASGGVSKWAIDGVPLETPSQYTLPSKAHLNSLITLAGGSAIAGKELKSAGSISSGGAWADPPEGSEDAVGIDRFGFAMLPGGIRSTTFAGLGQLGFLGSPSGFYLRMEYGVSSALSNTNVSYWVSIRALKTRGELLLDGQKIPTVLVGMQSWTAENLTGFGGTHVETVSEIYGDYYTYAQTLAVDEALKASGSTYRVPRSDEWAEFITTIGSSNAAAVKARESWAAVDGVKQGNNSSGMNILAAGFVDVTGKAVTIGNRVSIASITGSPANENQMVALFAQKDSNDLYTTASHGKDNGYVLRLTKRFYDVLMPWGQMLRFVKIGSLFVAQKNLGWRGDSIPRDFSKYPLLQERYIQAINERWDLTHQYKLRAKITLFAGFDKAQNYNVFAQSFAGNANGPVGLVWHPDYGLSGVSNQYCRATNQVVVTNAKVDLDAGTYDVEVSTEPTTVRLKVGSHDVIDRDGVRLNEVKPTVANVVSNFPGTIESLMVEDTTTGETIFEASKAELRGGLGRYYNDDPALAYLGMYYTFEEHNLIITELAKAGMPIATMDTTQWQALSTYNGGAAATQGLHLCDPASFTSPPDGMDDVYELGLLAGGAINQNNSSVALGSIAYYMHRAGLYGVNSSGAMVGWYKPDQLMSTYKEFRAPIRLCYAVS